MSSFTDWAHEKALRDTLYWLEKQPVSPEEQYEYGEYQYRLKDYQEAVLWYKKAAESFFIPAMYKLAYCMKHQLGVVANSGTETKFFRQVVAYDQQNKDVQAWYRLGMCYMYGYGVEQDEAKGITCFEQVQDGNMDALYEIGLSHLMGKGNYKPDKTCATECFYKAYQGFCEEAIFTLFAVFDGPFCEFPYIREIKEAYSFKLGQLLRVAELRPCREYWLRLADFYRQGYPGDSSEPLEKFQQLAQKYYEKSKKI